MANFPTSCKDIILATLFFGLVELAGCSGSTEQTEHQAKLSADVAPGVILIDVLAIDVPESGQPKYYFQYEVRPTTGSVRKVKEERFQDNKHEDIPHAFYQPTGAIESCRNDAQASSPDGEHLAHCRLGEAGCYSNSVAGISALNCPSWRSLRARWAPPAA
jgi:hypothetical protein